MLARRLAILISLLFLTSACSLAQRLDVAFVAGQSMVSDTTVVFSVQCFTPSCPPPAFTDQLKTDHHYYAEGTVGVHLMNLSAFSLNLEVPVAVIPSQKLGLPSTITFTNDMSSIFVTPSLKLKAFPKSPVAPWISAGGGWARYSVDPDIITNKGALQFGGGLDFRIGQRRWGFRGEVRDFLTSDPNLALVSGPFFGATKGGLHRHNVLYGGGLTLRF